MTHARLNPNAQHRIPLSNCISRDDKRSRIPTHPQMIHPSMFSASRSPLIYNIYAAKAFEKGPSFQTRPFSIRSELRLFHTQLLTRPKTRYLYTRTVNAFLTAQILPLPKIAHPSIHPFAQSSRTPVLEWMDDKLPLAYTPVSSARSLQEL